MALQVRFYACAGDPVAVAFKLARKALSQGEPMWVSGPAAELQRLSRELWLAPGFLAHAEPEAPEAVRRRSRLRLDVQAPTEAVPLWLNLGLDWEPAAMPAARVFDLIGPDPQQRAAGRQRYRRLGEAGLQPETVQVGAA